MEEVLYQFNPWWEGGYEVDAVERPRYLKRLENELEQKHVTFITGLRRVGKTTLARQLIHKLLNTVKPERILYISADHPVFEDHNLIEILREYRRMHGLSRQDKQYLFLDEVHMKKNFERDLKTLYDTEKVKTYATGSSSLVVKHKKPYLTGRSREIRVEPLDFQEYLDFNQVTVRKSEQYLLHKHLENYMRTGGMPEHVLRKDSQYLLDLVEGIIYKDIVGVYGIKNPDIVKKLFLLLAERVGKKLTYNKLANILEITTDTVKQYITHMEETYLINTVPRDSKSLNERIYSPKKIYLADTGIRCVFTGYRDIGALAENLVYNKIKNLGEVRYHVADKKEVDFIVDGTAVEVKYKKKISEDDIQPLRGLKTRKKVLITMDTKKEGDVRMVPLSEYILG